MFLYIGTIIYMYVYTHVYLRAGGNSLITKNTGHMVRVEEWKTWAPSVFIMSVIFVGTERNSPGNVSGVHAFPSYMSRMHPSEDRLNLP